MKLGTIIAFSAGAAVVLVGQRVTSTGQTSTRSARVSSEETCEALALLQTRVERPKQESEQAPSRHEPTAAAPDAGPAAPEVVSEATPPGATPPLPGDNHSSSDDATPQTPASTPAQQEPAADPPADMGLSGLALPPVSTKVADAVQLHQSVNPLLTSSTPTQEDAASPLAEAQTTESEAPVDLVPDLAPPTDSTANKVPASTPSVLHFAPPKQADPVTPDDAPSQESADPQATPKSREEETPAGDANSNAASETKSASSESTGLRTAEKPVARSTPIVVPPAAGEAVASDSVSAAEMEALKQKVRRVLDFHRDRMLNTRDHGAWEIMHSFIAYGIPKEVQIGGPSGRRVNAIGWLAFNGPSAGERLFTVGSAGPRGRLGPGLQGHEGQFLAMLAQSRVEPTYPMKVDGRDYTVEDLVKQEQATCRPATELTFKLIGLMHYLKSDTTWRDDTGADWDIPRLVKEELGQPIIGATCGGTHRLFALTYSYKKRQQRGEPVTGQYRRAQIYIQDFQDYTFKMQNPDGSFSTAFFAGRGALPDPQRRLETTGHIAEWLTFSLDDHQLRQPRMTKAMNYLATLLDENQNMPWKVGPLGHALHALNMYDSAVFGGTAYPWPMAPAPQTAASASP